MSNRGLVSIGAVTTLAGEIFLVHPNIMKLKYAWVGVIFGWLLFAIASSIAADKIYNKFLPTLKNESSRLIALILLYVIIVAVNFLIGFFLYH